MPVIAVAIFAAIASGASAAWFFSRGYVLYYGDAEARLNISRRLLDSRTPGLDQIGTAWLPLPALLTAPIAASNALWRSGAAGVYISALSFVLAVTFFFAGLRRLFGDRAAIAGAAILVLNPNMLYLQSTPMTEALLLCGAAALFYFTVVFRQTQSWYAVIAAAAASTAASMTRYDAWLLIPLTAAYLFWHARKHRLLVAAAFGLLAALWPMAWLAHNWWHYGNPLEFYNGPYSTKGIYESFLRRGGERQPGDHDLRTAVIYYHAAAQLVAGAPLLAIAGLGLIAALMKRAFWPVLLFGAVPLFYIWNVYGGGAQIFVPHLKPNSYYNTRYGLAALPFAAVLAASLVALVPNGVRKLLIAAVLAVSLFPWIRNPRPERWITVKESQVNSDARRAWTAAAAGYMQQHYRRGDGILMAFGDLTGILRNSGIPIRETLYDGNGPHWHATLLRPDLHMREEWAIAISGDDVSTAMFKLRRGPLRYECVRMIQVRGAAPIEIYRRVRTIPRP